MPIRRLVGWGFAAAGVSVVLVLVGGGWLIDRAGGVAFGGLPSWALTGLAAILAVALVGIALDRVLVAREHCRRSLPARPEFLEFDSLNQPMHGAEVGGSLLKDLTYVVFDTETTGLKPSAGDEIISIAGVRISGGEIDRADPFTRLVNPGKPIPRASIRFHGITDDMVADEAPVGDVLPGFKTFAGDAVLVAHNAAFDMKFLRLKEKETGVVFGNLVLDSLLLSVFLDHESTNHSLDAIAERLGVDIEGRHTALGDSIVTAEIFLRMLEMLEARGVTTLRQAIDASVRIEHVRRMQQQF